MSAGSQWSITAPQKLTFDDPVSTLDVRIVGGTVNVVGAAPGPARLEVSEIDGPPLKVSHTDGILSVGYDDLSWKGFRKWLGQWNRTAHVTLTVPAGTSSTIGVVGGSAVVSGLTGRAELRGVSGDFTLLGLTGPVQADTVSGRVEAQAVTGDLRFHSVSGDLTVVEGSGPLVRAESVSGDMVLDLAPAPRCSDIRLTTVSGEIAIRLPHPADAEVEANTASGSVSNGFEDLRVSGQWGAKRITGRLGAGNGSLKATTVSGAIALLRRPPSEEDTDTTDGTQGKVL
ncbi:MULTISPECIES: DUF4097 family beta strand repeat-containing protein [Streptomyces]|uniref:DUF4097 family beta strand repeat-containing protein n=1 Tax=Streptomyces TaxID=1883 RepID=UPI00085399E8|nr:MULTISPECIES: DUF4097 family beta strand repeat-containing protein [unclassified Streptomyces]MCC4319158.1 DUF4097 domain-containing protein [Streptomyces malaysiensis]AUA11304.1 hypothetical protein CFP59_03415 [Streptomyces sp. M56]MCD9593164.1 DUF4097 domain-containing protein [Streptomyces sp. 8ZJF_21]MCQ6251560.1 DUF4097 domain-containing protein [Streptomyces malaysiensis]MYX60104.1 DUF4097 family beta strand repeat protein [Streptomyces sp. SID8382]